MTHEDLLRRIELLIMEKAEKEEEHVLEIDEVITDTKASIVVAIWEAKIKLAEDLDNLGSWNIAGWCEALDKIIGKPATTTKDLRSYPTKEEKE